MLPMTSHTTSETPGPVRVQFLLAALMWTAAAVMLGSRSIGWLTQLHFGVALAAIALVLGWIKQHYIMRRVAGDAIVRIAERGPTASVLGFFAFRQWILVAVMMIGGIALRQSGIVPPAVLATVYATVAVGLLLGAGRFWQALALGD